MIAPPQTGVAALLKNPPAPGEAQGIQQAVPAMQPKASAPTSAPQSFVTPLKGRDLQQLLQEFNNPQSQYPKYAVLTAMKERQEADRLKSALQGQNAMQQAKQQGTIADSIVAGAQAGMPPPPRMLATGGPVAFAGGGGIPLGEREQADRATIVRELEGMGLTAGKMLAAGYDVFTMPVRGLAMVYNQLARIPRAFGTGQTLIPDEFTGGSLMPTYNKMSRKPEEAKASGPTYDPSADLGPGFGAPTPAPAATPEALKDTRGIPALIPPTPPGAASSTSSRVSSATRTPTGIATNDGDGVMKAMQARADELKGQQTLPPELLASREGLAKLREQQLAEERAAAQAYGKNSLAARDAALAKADTPLLRDPRGLLAIAAGIDTGKGKGFKSLAASTEKYLGGKDAAKTAAAEKYELSQEKLRGMETINRQMAVLNKEKEDALLQGDFNRANLLQQEIGKLAVEREKYGVERSDKAADRALEERKLAVQRESAAASRAAASRMTPQEFLYSLYKQGELPGFLEAQQGPKTEASLLKEVVAGAVKNPLTISFYPPEIQALINQEMRKLGGAAAAPALKYNPATGKIE